MTNKEQDTAQEQLKLISGKLKHFRAILELCYEQLPHTSSEQQREHLLAIARICAEGGELLRQRQEQLAHELLRKMETPSGPIH